MAPWGHVVHRDDRSPKHTPRDRVKGEGSVRVVIQDGLASGLRLRLGWARAGARARTRAWTRAKARAKARARVRVSPELPQR